MQKVTYSLSVCCVCSGFVTLALGWYFVRYHLKIHEFYFCFTVPVTIILLFSSLTLSVSIFIHLCCFKGKLSTCFWLQEFGVSKELTPVLRAKNHLSSDLWASPEIAFPVRNMQEIFFFVDKIISTAVLESSFSIFGNFAELEVLHQIS